MNKSYIIRDERGVLKAHIVQSIAETIFSDINGHWTNYIGGKRKYVIDQDAVYTAPLHQVRLYLWAGDTIQIAES